MRAAASVVSEAISERGLQAWLKHRLEELGSDSTDYVLVQVGKNSAITHHMPDKTVIEPGRNVLLDIAVRKDGYFADMTRNLFFGKPDPDYRRAFDLVRDAQKRAVAAIRPGATLGDVYSAAHETYRDAGYGRYALPGVRIGHGIGIDVHEPPSMLEHDDSVLAEGMVLTIEPGLYLPGKFGIRIEDVLAVKPGGAERLSSLTRDLIEI